MLESDAGIVHRTLHEDREAYADLVGRYGSAVMTQTLAFTGRQDEAEGLAQEAFFKAYRALPGLKRPAAFGAWLLGITRNVCYDWLRRRQREEAGMPREGTDLTETAGNRRDPAADTPAQSAERRETHAQVLAAVATLPTEYALTVTMKYQAGMSCQEIAEALEVPLGTVTSRLARAHQILRERLARYL